MIDTFLKAIYHTYFFDNEKSIKMNDTYDRYFFTIVSICIHRTEKWCLMIVY